MRMTLATLVSLCVIFACQGEPPQAPPIDERLSRIESRVDELEDRINNLETKGQVGCPCGKSCDCLSGNVRGCGSPNCPALNQPPKPVGDHDLMSPVSGTVTEFGAVRDGDGLATITLDVAAVGQRAGVEKHYQLLLTNKHEWFINDEKASAEEVERFLRAGASSQGILAKLWGRFSRYGAITKGHFWGAVDSTAPTKLPSVSKPTDGREWHVSQHNGVPVWATYDNPPSPVRTTGVTQYYSSGSVGGAERPVVRTGGGSHTHKCPRCGNVWGGPGHSHNCPNCGTYQNVIHGSQPAPARFRVLPQLRMFSGGGCAGGNCFRR